MNEEQLTRLRGRLERRKKRLEEAQADFFQPMPRRFYGFLTTNPVLTPILDEPRANVMSPGSGQQPQYPIGTVAFYGPNDKTTTKIAAGIFLRDGAEPILKRWVATNVTTNPKVQQEMQEFFRQYGVERVAMSQGNMGCPHEEGEDFPLGEDCPFCPFWKGKQGSNCRI